MFEYKMGDILEEDVEALVNTVNCVGVMGRGIALQFKKAFPDNFKAYATACKRNEIQPGKLFVYETNEIINPRYIINFPTKRHWRGKSRMEDIESGLNSLANLIKEQKIHSIAIPPLGSGLGGLNWVDVKERIEHALQDLEGVEIVIFEPRGAPDAEKMVLNREVPAMTASRATLVGLMNRYLAGLLDPFVTLLEVHKLMYFMQIAGEPLRLRYKKALYGPYAENLSHLLHVVEGHLVSGYADGGDDPKKQLALVPGAVEEATSFLAQSPDVNERFQRVVELVDGYESSFGLELLSTVHWVVDNERALSIEDVETKTYEWNERKRRFSKRQINLALENLKSKGWIDGFHSQT